MTSNITKSASLMAQPSPESTSPMAQPAPESPVMLQVGRCACCYEYMDARKGMKCLVDKYGLPVCHHKFCVSLECRKALEERKSAMLSSGKGCPGCLEKAGTSEFRSFAQLSTVVLPTDDAKGFFESINLSQTGSITKDEVAGFISSYFEVTFAAAMNMVTKKWPHWDTNQRSVLRRGFGLFNPTDGKLDKVEFETARAYLADLVQNIKVPYQADVGLKRSLVDDVPSQQFEVRNVRQRVLDFQSNMQSDLLLNLLRNAAATWFEKYDTDGSGTISKNELKDALAATLAGKLSEDATKSVVEGLWDSIDTDASTQLNFKEFMNFREVLLGNIDGFDHQGHSDSRTQPSERV